MRTALPPAITRGCVLAGGGVELLKAADASKDQTYFLHQLTQDQLGSTLFPLGDMTKRQVRALAREQGIPTYAKKDSTGICFIGERPFREFSRPLPAHETGPMQTPDGVVVGRHQGLAYYTLGQRQGLRIGGTQRWQTASHGFVAGKDPASNALRGCAGTRPTAGSIRASSKPELMHWIAGAPPRTSRLAAKTRYRMPDASCVLEPLDPTDPSSQALARPVRRSAVGADPGPVPGGVRQRRVPRRRGHRVGARNADDDRRRPSRGGCCS